MNTYLKRTIITGAALLAVLFSINIGTAQDTKEMKMPKAKTYLGTLVDSKCFGMNRAANAGNDHTTPMGKVPSCGMVCAKLGIPVALLHKDGKTVHLLAVPAPQLADYVSKEVRVTGKELLPGSLHVDKFEVQKDGKWAEVEIAYMMK